MYSLRNVLLVSSSLAFFGACSNDERSPHIVEGQPAALIQYAHCSALTSDLKGLLLADAYARIEQDRDLGRPVPVSEDDGDKSSGTRTEGEDFSGTNNQESGVDEADFVKTDGYGIYTLNGNRLHIFDVPEFGTLSELSQTSIEGRPTEMLLSSDDQKVVVFSQIFPYAIPDDHPLRDALGIGSDGADVGWRAEYVSKLTVLDIKDRKDPELVREIFFEGWYQTARLVDSALRMSTYSWTLVPGLDSVIWGSYERPEIERKALAKQYIDALELKDLIPRSYQRTPDGAFQTIPIDEETCRAFSRPAQSTGRGVSALVSVDLADPSLNFESDYIVTNWPTFYASAQKVYLADPAHDWWLFWNEQTLKDQTNIHVFDTSTAGRAQYLGSGRVDGSAWDSFNFSEFNGYLRVATTENLLGRWWQEEPEEPTTNVFVMELKDQRLQTIGEINNLAPGERLFASRFRGDRGYLVTFEMIDPLFTLDLSNPAEPKVVGELKVPGFSTYLHPVSDDALLSVGVGGDDNGANWRAQVSLFDTSNFAAPTTIDIEELVSEGEWGWSEALYEHKAFQYFKGTLAVPVANYTSDNERWHYVSQLVLLDIDAKSGITRRGAIDHSHLFNTNSDHYWNYREIRRSIFMGDFLYAISDRGITVHRLDDLSKVAEESLPGTSSEDSYWR